MFSYKSIVASWDRFFFEPLSTKGIGLFRIFWGLLILAYFFFDLANIETFYGEKAILSLKSALGQFPYPHLNLFQFIGVANKTLYTFMTIYGMAIICFIFGLYTKQALFILFVCMVSLHQRNIWLLSSSDLLIRLITFYLLFTPCERSYSLDKKRLNQKEFAELWGLRLIQIQVSVVYVLTVWQKLKGESWLDGTAVYYATRLEAFKNIEFPLLLDSIFNLRMISWMTLALELALGIMIWFKEFKRPLVILGILFHLGIELMMSIPFFELVMIVLLMTFVLDELVVVVSRLQMKKDLPGPYSLKSSITKYLVKS